MTYEMIRATHFQVRFDKVNGYTKIYDWTRYLTLFVYDAIYNRIRYLIRLKFIIIYVVSHYYTKIKLDSYDSFSRERRLTFHTHYNWYSLKLFFIKIKVTNTILYF